MKIKNKIKSLLTNRLNNYFFLFSFLLFITGSYQLKAQCGTCKHYVWSHPCGNYTFSNYGNANIPPGSATGDCNSIGNPGGSAITPTSVPLVIVGGVTLPQIGVTTETITTVGLSYAACNSATIYNVGGNIVFDFYVWTPSTASISGTTPICSGSSTILTANSNGGVSYQWSANAGNATTSAVTVNPVSTSTYTVTVTFGSGCTANATKIVTTNPKPTSSILSQSNVGCKGAATGSATVTGIGGTPNYTYSWSPGGQTTAGVSGLTTSSYNVTVGDANGCTTVQTVNITQPVSVLTSTISGTQSNVGCKGAATGSATVTGIGGTPNYTYSWSPGGQTTAGVSGLTTGSYNVTVRDANGCTTVQTVNITQPVSVLTSTISGTQSNVGCTGAATGSATVTGIGGTPNYTYSWSPGGQTTAGVSGLTTGSYNVTVRDANGCTTVQTVNITQPASAVSAVASATNATCGASNGTVTVTASGGTGGLTYLWAPSGQTTVTAVGLSAGSYNITVTDANGCTAKALTSVNNLGGPTVGISSQTNVLCNGSGTGSATVTATGGTGTLTYLWNPGAQTTASVTGLTAGTYIVTVKDANNCAQGQTITITQPASVLTSTISGTQSNVGCTGAATGSATVTGIGGTPSYTYSWSPGGQTTAGVSGLTTGSYNVTVRDANGCTKVQTVNITQPASIVSGITSSTNAACGSSNGTVSVTALGGTPGYNYNWSVGGTTTTVSGLTAGSYTVTVSDTNSCTVKLTVVVNGSPGPSLTVLSTKNISCNGLINGTATLTVTSGTAPYTYIWTPNISTNNTVNGLSAGTYTVVVNDWAGCKDTILITITEPLPLLFTITSSNLTVCAGESLTLLTTIPTGGTAPFTFVWLPNGPVVAPLIPTTYSVTVTDGSGCISQIDTIRVVPLLSPIAGFNTLSSGIFNEKYTFTDKSTGGITWYWNFGDGTTSMVENPFHIFKAGTYTVTQIVTGASGCTDTVTKIITILPNILIPNVFTPNHDGVNDEFYIPNTGFEKFGLEIFNRWGTKLFETNVGEIRWDGRTSAGVEASDGTYYFILTGVLKDGAAGKPYDTRGFVNLIRGGGSK